MKSSGALRAYVTVVSLAALAAFALIPARSLPEEWGTLLLLVVLAALGGAYPVRFGALRVQFTVSHPFVICALAALGTFEAMLISIATVAGTALSARQRPVTIRLAFNLGAQALSAAAAASVFVALGGNPDLRVVAMLWPLSFATATFFVANTGLVSVAIGLEKSQKILKTWKDSFLWTAVTYLTGLTLAACMLLIRETLGLWGLALAVPPCWLVLAFYRTHRERMEEQEKRIEEIEALNAELEAKVAERTQELRNAVDHIEETNRQLRDANARLTEASRAKSEFLANVSHELRTPLNAVIGFSDLLGDPDVGTLNPRQRELLADIEASGEHLLNLINDILDLSKVEAAKMELHRSHVEIADLVHRSVAMVRHQAEKKRLQLADECSPDVRLANVDPGMFRGVLVNLLTNAVKFTPEGGRVGVRVYREDADLIAQVEDTGIGIPEEDQKRVFQEFYQVDGSYSREYHGTGLGLALVRRMMQMHRGTIALESEEGKGSRFTCRYPDCLIDGEETVEPVREIVAPVIHSQRKRTILLVEDHALTRKLARNALRSRGHRVIEATTGEEALEKVRQQRPDLILMDLQLPGMDGLEVTRRLKGDPSTAGIPVVAVTALAQSEDERSARAAGCVGYITKPIRLSRFPDQVERFFEPKESVA